ncbi:MAG: hypothetical protein IH616_03385 [Gemmatimonadales bacterium]|nr:hypothetical protein [Gemmatimonadales bacterium]
MRRSMVMAIPLLFGLGFACGPDNGEVTAGDLVATWEADSFVYADLGQPGTEVDLIGMGGAVTITFDANGTYRMTATVIDPHVERGTRELIGTHQLNLTETGATAPAAYLVSIYDLNGATVLSLSGDDVLFDFGDGEIPARLAAAFVVK